MKTLLAAFLLSAPASAAPILEHAAALAAGLDVRVFKAPAAPEAPPSVVQPVTSTRRRFSARPLASGSASGSAWVSGSASLTCSGTNNANGSFYGWIRLRTDVRVNVAGGATANVPIEGTVHLSGPCSSGSVSGSTNMSGAGTLYRAGRAVGSVHLSGWVNVHQQAFSGFIHVNQHVMFSGSYREN